MYLHILVCTWYEIIYFTFCLFEHTYCMMLKNLTQEATSSRDQVSENISTEPI